MWSQSAVTTFSIAVLAPVRGGAVHFWPRPAGYFHQTERMATVTPTQTKSRWRQVPALSSQDYWRTCLVIALIGCSSAASVPPPGAGPIAPVLGDLRPMPSDSVFLLEQSGLSPRDTTVVFQASKGRSIVMRHVAPDNAIFAILAVPPDSGSTELIEVALNHVPGLYGIRVNAQPRLPEGSTLTFSYAIHFQAPVGALGRYRTRIRFSNSLGIAELQPDGRLKFQRELRPATDILSAAITSSGEFYVAAPR
jgi:hypothetical protein